jgi:hypothetical protein
MKTYPSLDAYNADVTAAREAYAADMAVREGLCADCKWRKRDKAGRKRLCTTCRRAGVKSR